MKTVFNRDLGVVWLKRDLRLYDHEALQMALRHNKTLIVFSFEPILLEDDHYSLRHFRFIAESLQDIDQRLTPFKTKVCVLFLPVISVFDYLKESYGTFTLYSHLEVGVIMTYKRDIEVNKWCSKQNIIWHEIRQNGIGRGLKNRKGWSENWELYMKRPIKEVQMGASQMIDSAEIENIESDLQPQFLSNKFGASHFSHFLNTDNCFQKGGTTEGLRYLNSFLDHRHESYAYNISKPHNSMDSCSRLSPYIAWGNLSVRQVWQEAKQHRSHSNNKKSIDQFTSRIRWQSHFIQKFESECSMEFRSVNRAYHSLLKNHDEDKLNAWESGQTGIPIVDASMRCLRQTGYLNFRMRALVVSFATHLLWLPWQSIAKVLARWFLDFEPGIHYPQLQMQAGETGINQIRIYNPIKNSYQHDSEALFILKWIPELSNIPNNLVHEPYLLTPLESSFYQFEIGKDYPKPIIDLNKSRKFAADTLYAFQKCKITQKESLRILEKHTMPDRKAWSNANNG